jgi:L-ascorbate metabolism protein UlaG (beta-lactamase superfamily)
MRFNHCIDICILFAFLAVTTFSTGCVQYQSSYSYDGINVTWLGHSSVRLEAGDNTIYIDPYALDNGPRAADFILITHDHADHCSLAAVERIQTKNNTKILGPMGCIKNITGRIFSINAYEFYNFSQQGVYVEAFPAYNINSQYHLYGEGVGYLVEAGGKKIYVTGDSDNIPEFSNLTGKNIDILLLPIGGKYTMNAEEAAQAAGTIKPKVAVPIHFNSEKYGLTDINADPEQFKRLAAGLGIEVKILVPVA